MSTIFTQRRIQLIALLIVAAFSVAAVAVSSTSAAQPAAASKKKSKKCKKGYVKKKVRGRTKCVKKKSTVKKSDLVEKVTLTEIDSGAHETELFVRVKLKKSATSLKVVSWAKRGSGTAKNSTTVPVAADQLEHNFVTKVRVYHLRIDPRLRNQKYGYWVEIDGVKSNVLP